MNATMFAIQNGNERRDGTTQAYAIYPKLVQPAITKLNGKTITVGSAIGILRRTMEILINISEMGYAHRNVNPCCIMVKEDSEQIFLDGFLFAAHESDELSTLIYPCIDNAFVAPEVAAGGFGGLGSDMYSVTLILDALFTGQSLLGTPSPDQPLPNKLPQAIKDAIYIGLSGDSKKAGEFVSALDQIQTQCEKQWDMPIIAVLNEVNNDTNVQNSSQIANSSEVYALTKLIDEAMSMDLQPGYFNDESFPLGSDSPGMSMSVPTSKIEEKVAKLEKDSKGIKSLLGISLGVTGLLLALLLAVIVMYVSGFGGFGAAQGNQIPEDDPGVESSVDLANESTNTEFESSGTEAENLEQEIIILDTPSGITLTIEETSIVVRWSAVENANGYIIQFADNSSFEGDDITEVDTANLNDYDAENPECALADNGWTDNYIRVQSYTVDDETGEKTLESDWSDTCYMEIKG